MSFFESVHVDFDDDNEHCDIDESYAESASQIPLKICMARNDITTALPLIYLTLNLDR